MQKRYTVPRFQAVSLIVFTIGPFELTVRQMIVLLLSVVAGLNLWPLLSGWPLLARCFAVGIVSLLILPFGWVEVGGRSLEAWLSVVLRYWSASKICVWRPVRGKVEEET